MPFKVSVIIPTRNAGIYLEECLSSIKRQEILNPDVIVDILIGVDHCEETLKHLRKILIHFPAVKAFYFHEHLGPYIIRNTLATLSDADYLVFFDSDDVMSPGFLQDIIEPAQSHDIVRFGLKDFIEVNDKNGVPHRIFNKTEISKFEKSVLDNQAISIEGKPSVLQKIYNFRKSKYLKPDRYYNFIRDSFKRRRSGVFAIKKSVFFELNGFKAWPVQADIEFISRAMLANKYAITSPKNIWFLRRIHNHNITSNYNLGMNSQIRKEYQIKSETSVYQTEPFIINSNYSEIVQ